jgi:hypothetical protein
MSRCSKPSPGAGGLPLLATNSEHRPSEQRGHVTMNSLVPAMPGVIQFLYPLRMEFCVQVLKEMEALLFYNGFQIRSCYGSWQQEPLTATSPSMIYVCQRRV